MERSQGGLSELRSGSVTLIPLSWGSHGVEIRALKETWRFLVTLATSCTFPPYKKKKKKKMSERCLKVAVHHGLLLSAQGRGGN